MEVESHTPYILNTILPPSLVYHNNSFRRRGRHVKHSETTMRIGSHNLILFQTTLLVGFFLVHNSAFDMIHHNIALPSRRSSLHHRRETSSDPYLAKQHATLLMSTYTSVSTSRPQDAMEVSSKLDLQHQNCNVKQSTVSYDIDEATSIEASTTTKTKSVSISPSDGTDNISNCSWIVVAAVFLFGQLFNKGDTSAMMGPSSTGHNNSMIYSAVSASLLRHQHQPRRGVFPLNVQTLLTWGIVLWQLSSKAVPVGKLLLSYATMFPGWYMNVLDSSPLVTKSLTTAVIGFLGDSGAQYVEERIRSKKEGSKRPWFQSYDRRRGLSIVGGSILVTGPMLHIAYNILEHLIPVAGGGATAAMAALAQVLINDFVLDAIFVATTFVTTGVAEGYSHQIIPQLRKDYFATIKASWATSLGLMPLEFVCFRFLPLSFRVLGMNFIDIFWEALISYMIHRRRRMDTAMASTASSAVPSLS